MTRTSKRLDPRQTGHDAEKLHSDLHKRIVGQDDAIDQIVNIYQTFLAGMSTPGRPIGNMLFLGPTGSGKTRTVECLAESLVGDARAVIKIDCAEFQHSHEIAKLIGSPPGYLGHRETHPLLSQEVLNQYHTEKLKVSFVLFDEIEKASDALWNLLLGILDKATLTLGDNRRVDFSRAMIFMTSNLGASEMNAILSPKLGFRCAEIEGDGSIRTSDERTVTQLSRSATEAARKKFTPEFMNRIDKIVVFQPLGTRELGKILDIEWNALQQRIFTSYTSAPFVLSLTAEAREFLLADGTDIKYGARHLKRAIERGVVHPLSNLLASGQVVGGDLIQVDHEPESDALVFTKEDEGLPAVQMARLVDMSVMMPPSALAAARDAEPARVAGARSRRA